jgi:hypothetical protein
MEFVKYQERRKFFNITIDEYKVVDEFGRNQDYKGSVCIQVINTIPIG